MTEVEAWQSLHPQPGIPFPQSFIQQQQAPSFVHAAAFGAPQQPPQQQQQRQPFAAHAPFVQGEFSIQQLYTGSAYGSEQDRPKTMDNAIPCETPPKWTAFSFYSACYL